MNDLPKLERKHKLAILYLMVVSLIWGAAGPIIKLTLEYLPPFTFLFLRFLVATVFVLPFLIAEDHKHPVSRKDWVNLILLSFLGGTMTLAFVFLGFSYTSSLDGSIISAMSPIIILVASSKLLGEKISPNEKKGAIISLAGTFIIIIQPILEVGLQGNTASSLYRLLGNILILASLITWTAYTIWSKKLFDHRPSKLGSFLHYFHLRSSLKEYSPFFVTGVLCLVSLISFTPLAAFELATHSGFRTPSLQNFQDAIEETYEFPQISSDMVKPIFGVFYMGIMSTLVAYGLYEWAIKQIPVAETAIFSYLAPIFAIPVAYILLGEKISFWFIVGCVIIGYGVYISEKNRDKIQ
ncbi:MAG: DMT family transporter [Patescibacteria group bacterium]